MIATDVLGAIAATWGVIMAISPLLQIRRILARRSSDDISLSYLLVLEIGFVLWFSYGIALGNLAIVVPNVFAFSVGLILFLVAMRFRTAA